MLRKGKLPKFKQLNTISLQLLNIAYTIDKEHPEQAIKLFQVAARLLEEAETCARSTENKHYALASAASAWEKTGPDGIERAREIKEKIETL